MEASESTARSWRTNGTNAEDSAVVVHEEQTDSSPIREQWEAARASGQTMEKTWRLTVLILPVIICIKCIFYNILIISFGLLFEKVLSSKQIPELFHVIDWFTIYNSVFWYSTYFLHSIKDSYSEIANSTSFHFSFSLKCPLDYSNSDTVTMFMYYLLVIVWNQAKDNVETS